MADSSNPPTPRALLQKLESLQAAGVTQLPRKLGVARPQASVETSVAREAPLGPPHGVTPGANASGSPAIGQTSRERQRPEESPANLAPRTAPQPSVAGSAATLDILGQQVAGCTACGELASTRTQTVFGVGNPKARLCFLGEAPGADEDRLGEPFVGKAGQLLTKMLGACRLSRDDVYLLNVLKCRPPGNRNPSTDEAHNCRPFLLRQLELIDPEYVCCLGAVAAQNFLETDTPIGRLRGRVHEKAGRKVVCTYHPAYLLRNPSAKKAAWDDLKMLMAELGIEL